MLRFFFWCQFANFAKFSIFLNFSNKSDKFTWLVGAHSGQDDCVAVAIDDVAIGLLAFVLLTHHVVEGSGIH